MLDPVAVEGMKLAAATALGYGWQWARAPERINNLWSWLAFSVLAAGAYIWISPDWMKDWRLSLMGAYLLVQSARGTAASAKDMKAAPATNSL